jgi:hypothetical protein
MRSLDGALLVRMREIAASEEKWLDKVPTTECTLLY